MYTKTFVDVVSVGAVVVAADAGRVLLKYWQQIAAWGTLYV